MKALRFVSFFCLMWPVAIWFALIGFFGTLKWGVEMMAECLDE
jgi:hypothetical protein